MPIVNQIPPGSLCIVCGINPRPKRKNWEEVYKADEMAEGSLEVDSHHHRCGACYRKAQQAEHDADAAYFTALVMESPSWKWIKKGRVAFDCEVCGQSVEIGIGSWRVVVPGPRTVKVCDRHRRQQ